MRLNFDGITELTEFLKEDMKARFALSIVLVVALLAAVLVLRIELDSKVPISPVDVKSINMEETAGRYVVALNQVCSELHLQPMNYAWFPMTVEADEDEYGIGPGPTFKLNDHHAYSFTFLQSDKSLTSLANDQLFDKLFASKAAPLYDKADKPKWTKDEAIRIGNAFLKVFANQIKVKLGDAGARYDHQFQQTPKYYIGEWMIGWPRVDSKGHVFSDDAVVMRIPEGYGPTSVQIKLTTAYTEQTGDPMSLEKALTKVQQKIGSDNFWEKIRSIFPGTDGEWIDPNPTGAYLQIVIPRHQKGAPARLAWVFWFKCHFSHSHFPISYWIDAYNGKYIGGDVVGLDTPD